MKAFLLFISIFISHKLKCQNNFGFCNYKQTTFDSDTCCWRKLSAKDSFVQAGDLLIDYLACNSKKQNSLSLKWHAAQMFACAGMNLKAKKYFRKTYNVFYKWFGGKDGMAWYFYAKGTVAFLIRRKTRLQKIIDKWDEKLPKDLNYESLVKLYSNFDSSYRVVLHNK